MLYIAIGLCILSVIWLWVKKSDSEPPELSGKLPLIGHGHWFLCSSTRLYDTIQVMAKEALEKDGVVKCYMGPRTLYGIVDPDDSVTILNTCHKKQYFYDFMRPLCGNGLLTADAPTWKIHRKLLNPAFNLQILIGFLDVFNAQAQNMVNCFAENLNNTFDHEKIIKMVNLETICLTATGVDTEECDTLRQQYLDHFDKLLRICNKRSVQFWLHNDFIYKWSPLKKKEDEEAKHISALSDSIVQIKKSEILKPAYIEDKSGKPFLELILELAKENRTFTDQQIREEMNTIIAAGHDTNSTTMTIALTLLGSYPEVQEKAFQEVNQIFSNSERPVLQEDLPKLVYTEAVLKETLRLYPIAILIGRQLDKDVKLRNYTLKANSACMINVHGLHRHEIWGPDANEFKPERWLDKDTLPDSKYYAALGVGRRSCIGKTYAIMSMKINVVYILRRYRISSDVNNMKLQMKTLLRLSSGFHISLQERTV